MQSCSHQILRGEGHLHGVHPCIVKFSDCTLGMRMRHTHTHTPRLSSISPRGHCRNSCKVPTFQRQGRVLHRPDCCSKRYLPRTSSVSWLSASGQLVAPCPALQCHKGTHQFSKDPTGNVGQNPYIWTNSRCRRKERLTGMGTQSNQEPREGISCHILQQDTYYC